MSSCSCLSLLSPLFSISHFLLHLSLSSLPLPLSLFSIPSHSSLPLSPYSILCLPHLVLLHAFINDIIHHFKKIKKTPFWAPIQIPTKETISEQIPPQVCEATKLESRPIPLGKRVQTAQIPLSCNVNLFQTYRMREQIWEVFWKATGICVLGPSQNGEERKVIGAM